MYVFWFQKVGGKERKDYPLYPKAVSNLKPKMLCVVLSPTDLGGVRALNSLGLVTELPLWVSRRGGGAVQNALLQENKLPAGSQSCLCRGPVPEDSVPLLPLLLLCF